MVHTDIMMTKVLYPRAALGSSQTDWETGQEEQGARPGSVVFCHRWFSVSDPQLSCKV